MDVDIHIYCDVQSLHTSLLRVSYDKCGEIRYAAKLEFVLSCRRTVFNLSIILIVTQGS